MAATTIKSSAVTKAFVGWWFFHCCSNSNQPQQQKQNHLSNRIFSSSVVSPSQQHQLMAVTTIKKAAATNHLLDGGSFTARATAIDRSNKNKNNISNRFFSLSVVSPSQQHQSTAATTI